MRRAELDRIHELACNVLNSIDKAYWFRDLYYEMEAHPEPPEKRGWNKDISRRSLCIMFEELHKAAAAYRRAWNKDFSQAFAIAVAKGKTGLPESASSYHQELYWRAQRLSDEIGGNAITRPDHHVWVKDNFGKLSNELNDRKVKWHSSIDFEEIDLSPPFDVNLLEREYAIAAKPVKLGEQTIHDQRVAFEKSYVEKNPDHKPGAKGSLWPLIQAYVKEHPDDKTMVDHVKGNQKEVAATAWRKSRGEVKGKDR